MNKRNIFLLTCALHVLHLHQVECAQVMTQNGAVEGVELLTAEQNRTYHAFFGIPYAQPPVGDLRFQPPQPAQNWTGIWNASYERDICVQTSNLIGVTGSENCLYLNVFTTELGASKPVMFWIHGGGFTLGSGNVDSWGPDYLLNEDVVLVTINYRLGFLGFMSTQDMVVPGNNALKDQILALGWVKANIANFGGDPNKVTIFGQSAGSTCVSYIVQSELSAGLYRAAVMQSGTTLCPWGLMRTPRNFAFEVGRRLLINTNDSSTLVRRLRNVGYAQLHIASDTLVEMLLQYFLLADFILAPVQEPVHPGAVFTSKSCVVLGQGKFNRVPLMVGFNSEEGSWLAPAYNLLRPLMVSYDLNRGRLVPEDMNIENSATVTAVGRLIHSHYVGTSGLMVASPTGLAHYFSDTQFVRPIRQYVKFVQNYTNAYYYQFSYEGVLGNPSRGNLKGVGHGEDLNYIFRVEGSDDASPSDVQTRKRMVKMWTNFAKHGNPTPTVDPLLQNATWSVASTSPNLTYMDIGGNLVTRTNPHMVDMEFWDDIYVRYGKPPCDTF